MRTYFLLSLATLTIASTGFSAQAETLSAADRETIGQTPASESAIAPEDAQTLSPPTIDPQLTGAIAPIEQASPITVASDTIPIPGTTQTSSDSLQGETAETIAQFNQTQPGTTTPGTTTPGTTPGTTTPGTTTPGTTTPRTTPIDLTVPTETTPETEPRTPTSPTDTTPRITPTQPTERQTTPPATPAPSPTDGLSPGRATRSGSSYIGIGGNIGIGTGDTAIGDGSFVVLSKIGLTRVFSVRPSVFVNDDPTVLIPITYDLVPRTVDEEDIPRFRIAPYLGIGPVISFGSGDDDDGGDDDDDDDGDDTDVDLLLTAGVDVPLTPQFTGTAAVNVSVLDNAAVGILIGVGYNFR